MIRTIRRFLASAMAAIAMQPASRAATVQEPPVQEHHISWREEADAQCVAMVRPEIAEKYDGPRNSADEQIMVLLSARNVRFRNTALMPELARQECEEFIQARMR